MPRPLAHKLGVAPDHRLLVLDAPAHYTGLLDPPPGVRVDTAARPGARYDGVHLFVRTRADVERAAPAALAAAGPDTRLWLCYPKRSGALASDLSRDTGWDTVLAAGWEPVAQVAVDPDWSALRYRPAADITYTPGSYRWRRDHPG
ncbi:hypothetical protein [Nocardiopsis trehalosi]|uniref:hypothetical protein n=1 Tax=Nocardiopsis trehalosi TaxID=109329 RepID=UPI0008373370|nr:hypothetical protein [Nocardiopsis trehalosi]